jgi:hypothetical protein
MKKIVALPIIAAIAAIAVYYASPLFINATVDEPLPTAVEMMDKEMMMDKEKAEMMEKQVPTAILSGSFVGAGDGIHNAEGIARVLAVNDGQSEHRILRLENFRSTNGPDLYVYLSKDARGINDGYVELARLKGNIGNQNYHIPDDVNLGEYSNVLIWCKQFSVLFGYADLAVA